MNQRTAQIMAAMKGRQASAVNDDRLRASVRFKVEQLAKLQRRELTKSVVESCTNSAVRASAHTIIFEDEVCIALEMGAAGELGDDKIITRENCSKWVTLYAVCPDRSAAQQQISLNSARDRKRLDAVVADELRRDFQENGLRRAWETFLEEGAWTFRPGYGAALYDKIGRLAVGSLLGSDVRARATVDAVAACRHDYPQKYRTAPEEEILRTDVFKMHKKALLARAYFETLRERALDITYNPVAV